LLLSRGEFFPFLDIHVAEAFSRFFAPAKAAISKLRIEHNGAAFRAGALYIVFPELDLFYAQGAPPLGDIRRFPKGRIHSGTLGHAIHPFFKGIPLHYSPEKATISALSYFQAAA
jgi:hypothetical protein